MVKIHFNDNVKIPWVVQKIMSTKLTNNFGTLTVQTNDSSHVPQREPNDLKYEGIVDNCDKLSSLDCIVGDSGKVDVIAEDHGSDDAERIKSRFGAKDKSQEEHTGNEQQIWKKFALVMDRAFFCVHLTIMVAMLAFFTYKFST